MIHPYAAGTLAALLVAIPLAAASAKSGLSDEEKKIVRAVDAGNGEAEALLERVVNFNSGTMNFEGVREVGKILRAEFDALGFATRWIDGAPFERAGHLVATYGTKGPRLLLIGHLDTVFERDSPFQKWERLAGGRVRGPGVIDMKGGDVIALHALKALKEAGLLDRLRVTVIFTGDEEKSGRPLLVAREALIEAAKNSDVALGFEDGPGKPELAVIARRGSTDWVLRSTGTAAHSSQIFSESVGPGAVFEAARVLEGFRRELSGERYLTLSPGVIAGGTSVEFDAEQNRGVAFGKDNVVAEHAVVQGDIRAISPEQLAMARERMRTIAAQSLPHTHSEIMFDDGYPPFAPTDGNRKLLALYDEVSRDLGFGAVSANDPITAGAADIAFTNGLVSMGLDGLGLCGADDHTDRETADISKLPSQTKRAAVLMYRLSKQWRPGRNES